MAASDTLIGITGAVLLVGVMVGVFVYEYNNADGGGGGDPPALQNATMSFDGDLDPGVGLVEAAVLGEYTFAINASVTQFRVDGNLSGTAPGAGSVTVQLLRPDGSVAPGSVDGSAGTFSLGVDRPAEGTWTLRFTTEAAHPGGSYTGELKTTYESA